MQFSTLYFFATLTAVWATSSDPYSTLAKSGSQTPAHVVGQELMAEAHKPKYCAGFFFDRLESINKAAEQYRAESPNNKLPYSEFRRLAAKYCFNVSEVTEAMDERRDPELLKTFHLRFTEEKINSGLAIDHPGPKILQFFRTEIVAEEAEAKAVQAFRDTMVLVDAAEKAREEAESLREDATREKALVDEYRASGKKINFLLLTP